MPNPSDRRPRDLASPEPLSELIHELLAEYPINDRRDVSRHTFFRPATIFLPGKEARRLFAFTRDISPDGIGLLHHLPLPQGEVVVVIDRRKGEPLLLRTRITWCEPCSDAWYLSGGRLLGLIQHREVASNPRL